MKCRNKKANCALARSAYFSIRVALMTDSTIWSSKRLIKSSQDIIKFLIDYILIELKLTKL